MANKKEATTSDIVSYSHESLKKLRSSPFSEDWPNYLDEGYKNTRGMWDPELWHRARNPAQSGENGPNYMDSEDSQSERDDASQASDLELKNITSKNLAEKRKPKEEDDIVLCPQRKSFLEGCHVDPPTKTRATASGNHKNNPKLSGVNAEDHEIHGAAVEDSKTGGKKYENYKVNDEKQRTKEEEDQANLELPETSRDSFCINRETMELSGAPSSNPNSKWSDENHDEVKGEKDKKETEERDKEKEEARPNEIKKVRVSEWFASKRIGSGRIIPRTDEEIYQEYKQILMSEEFRIMKAKLGSNRKSNNLQSNNIPGGSWLSSSEGEEREQQSMKLDQWEKHGKWPYRGGSFGNRSLKSESEEPEWMSEKFELGDMMELKGFDESPQSPVVSLNEGSSTPDSLKRSMKSQERSESSRWQDLSSVEYSGKVDAGKGSGAYDMRCFEKNDLISGFNSTFSGETNPKALKENALPKYFQNSRSLSHNQGGERHFENTKPNDMNLLQDQRAMVREGNIPKKEGTRPILSNPEGLRLNGMNGTESSFSPVSSDLNPGRSQQLNPYPSSNNSLFDFFNARQTKESPVTNDSLKSVEDNQASYFNKQNKLRDEESLGFKNFGSFMESYKMSQVNCNNSSFDTSGMGHSQIHPNSSSHLSSNVMHGRQQIHPGDRKGSENYDSLRKQQMQKQDASQFVIPNIDILEAIHQAPFNYEMLQLTEVKTLLQALDRRQTTPEALLNQFIFGQLSKNHREILCNVLKILQKKGLLPLKSQTQAKTSNPVPSPSSSLSSEPMQNYQKHISERFQTFQNPSESLFQYSERSSGSHVHDIGRGRNYGTNHFLHDSVQRRHVDNAQNIQNTLVGRKENLLFGNQYQGPRIGAESRFMSEREALSGPVLSSVPSHGNSNIMKSNWRDLNPSQPRAVSDIYSNLTFPERDFPRNEHPSGISMSDQNQLPLDLLSNRNARRDMSSSQHMSSHFPSGMASEAGNPSHMMLNGMLDQPFKRNPGNGLSGFLNFESLSQAEYPGASSVLSGLPQRAMTLDELEKYAGSVRH